MLDILINSCIIIFYISLAIELFIYDVPSIVATRKILNPNLTDPKGFSKSIQKVFKWSKLKKLTVFVLPMVFIYLLHLYPAILFFNKYYFSDVFFSNNYSLGYLGIVLVILGRIISHLYLIKIKKIKEKTFDNFVIEGIFKISRNPGLLGLYISFLGFLAIQPSTPFILCYLVYILHMHFKILMEEDYLKNKHYE